MNQGKPAAGFAAGGHYDPGHTKKHLGPLSTAGHRGDLPVLVVDSRGDATEAVTAPHLAVEQIRGRSIMIHAGSDNYSDTPAPLGGGGARNRLQRDPLIRGSNRCRVEDTLAIAAPNAVASPSRRTALRRPPQRHHC
jgi:hypothetical protein